MTWEEIIKIISGLLLGLGGVGGILLAFSKYLADLFEKRYEKKIKMEFQNQLNEYQHQLEILKQSTIRYSDKQFKYYSKLWVSLFDLKLSADELWKEANSRRLSNFSRQLKRTQEEIERSALFVEESHFAEL